MGSIIGSATKILLGEKAGKSSLRRGYFISVSDTGAILRIDYNIYSKQVTGSRLITVTKNIFLYTYVISSADLRNLQSNDLAAAVELSFGKLTKDDKNDLIAVLEEKLKKSVELKKLL